MGFFVTGFMRGDIMIIITIIIVIAVILSFRTAQHLFQMYSTQIPAEQQITQFKAREMHSTV
jgi:Na+/proline symporter